MSLLMLLLSLCTLCIMNMEQVNFGTSLKNIPIPSKQDYLFELIHSVGVFVANLRWRVFFFLNPVEQSKIEKYGFKSTKPAPNVKELKQFEDSLYDLVNVKFKQSPSNTLQNTLKQNITDMINEERVYVPADKTHNFYKIAKDAYNNLVAKNVEKDYKKCSENIIKNINRDDKIIAESLELDDRVYAFCQRDAFVNIKDHKPNYRNNTKCRLLNSAKSDIGKISKQIISRVVKSVRAVKKFNQWKNSFEVIDWFNKLERKNRLSFIEFDIIEFYPSISEDVLKKSLEWAKTIVDISEEEINIILQTKIAPLFFNNQCWIKKGSKAFDVSMGSWDGAEVSDIVGLYLLSQLQDVGFDLGLYRDDGLGVTSLTPRLAEKEKQKVCKIFQENGFDIKVNVNVKNVNFLDINLDLSTFTYRPYMKDNETPIYVHSNSNHPQGVLQNIPKSVNLRLSKISSNKNVFDSAKGPYQEALNKSGYDFTLEYDPPVAVNENKKKKIEAGK